MPGIEPGSKRVIGILYMCSRFVILLAFVNGKKANSCPEVLQIKSSGGDLILRSIVYTADPLLSIMAAMSACLVRQWRRQMKER